MADHSDGGDDDSDDGVGDADGGGDGEDAQIVFHRIIGFSFS